ncbi:TPA: UbiH/UbiF/VisC/COQ6 family ubiquinone biosynthesis hydroxylase [Legionella pneumophila]|nr:FAD-dependent oxidoreductase [Legionella pneumophila]HAU1321191.1 UbiH/UbiF/VisC/COQ6 family ubiquinone biosynthesis hydroxylase [Legionella pneumophila]HBC0467210.1 UbiH/UbiF/VisC/COQ6 family ubiquinone biosynthesis hydroxylase [Legionella pneumophila]HBD9374266.1 UbiH/UbiF/VisC/COQ6 family ubiquinone biosynthesis hydroxylase [Legionella pneumophila]HBI2946818.1 UbiH/UbiF/VisC/COQ6 family ubiquinone biosynthesis hydroxylase [Legionella pneumophila]
MSQQFDVLVIGGGIVGLTAALAMAQRHYTVAVIDAGILMVNTDRSDLRVYAINKASKMLLSELGVWQHLNGSRVAPYNKMHVWDGVSGAYIDFDSRSIAEPNLGAIIEESILKQALFRQISLESNISLFPQSAIDEVFNLEQSIKISSQNIAWEGQLLMIADGANSPTRHKLKVDLTSWSYEQQAIVATINSEKSHQNTAFQVFNPDGPLAFLPLSNPNQSSIVWSTHADNAMRLKLLDDNEFSRELTKAFGGHLGQIKVVSRRHQFPLQMRHVKQYVGHRWLLLGDAAHTIHPLAGLGLNVGLADVKSWLNCLEMSRRELSSNKILRAYQRERKHSVWQIVLLMEGFKRLFGTSASPITSLRSLGLRACNELTPIKRLFIRHAGGL